MKIRYTVLAAVTLLGASLAGCNKAAAPEADQGRKGGKRGGSVMAFSVEVATVQKTKAEYEVTAPGVLDAFERVQVTARVAGTVDKVAFTEGQQVAKGAVLVIIDAERYRLAVNSARAAFDKTVAAQADVEAMALRRESVSADHPGLITGEEVASYKTKTLTAKADTAVAREALRAAELNLRDASVRAPMEGVIQTRTVETGQYIQPGYVMATLLRNEPTLLRFSVTPEDAPRIKPDMIAEFRLRASQLTYKAKVTLVAGAADLSSHMVSVTAEVDNEGRKYWLRPGSFCDVVVKLPAKREVPLIPRTAIRASDRGLIAYIVEGDVARERVLELGMTTKDGWVEVRAGLEGGEQLVVRGAEPLSEGAKVRVDKPERGPVASGSAAPDATVAVWAGAEAPAPATPSAPPPGSASAGSHEPRDKGAKAAP